MSAEKSNSSVVQQGFRPGGRHSMGAPTEKPKDGKKSLQRLLGYFRPEMKYVLLLALVVVITVLASVITPSLQSKAIDNLVSGAFARIPHILGIMLALYMIHGGATLLQGFLSSRLSQRVIYRLRSELFNKVISLPIPYVDNHSHGDIMSRMTNDAENVSNVISSSLSSLFSGVLTLIGTVAGKCGHIVLEFRRVDLYLLSCYHSSDLVVQTVKVSLNVDFQSLISLGGSPVVAYLFSPDTLNDRSRIIYGNTSRLKGSEKISLRSVLRKGLRMPSSVLRKGEQD